MFTVYCLIDPCGLISNKDDDDDDDDDDRYDWRSSYRNNVDIGLSGKLSQCERQA